MANPWYTRVFSALAGTKVRSKDLKDELDLIVAAFDAMPTPAALYGTTVNFAVATLPGAADAYAMTVSNKITAYADGLMVRTYFGTPNTTTTPTMNVNAIGPKTVVRQDGSAVAVGDLAGVIAMQYSATTEKLHIVGAGVVAITAAINAANTATAAAATAAAAAGAASTSASNAAASALAAQGYAASLGNINKRIHFYQG